MEVKAGSSFRASPDWFLAGDGDVGALFRAHDWANSPLGAPDTWSQVLRSTVAFILESTQPICLMWGPERLFLYNDAYAPFLAARHPSAIGRPAHVVWPEIWDVLVPLVDQTFAGQSTSREDQHLVMQRNGFAEDTWWTFTYSPVRDETGAVAGLINICSDSTAKVLAQREAAAERDRAKNVLENMHEAFVLLDADFRIIDINAAAMRFEDRPREQLLGMTHWEAHPDAAPELDKLYRTAMADRRPMSLEHHYRWPNGRDLWIDLHAFPVGGGLAVLYRDVTKRRRAERRLRASEARQRFLLDLGDRTRRMADPEDVIAEVSRALGERLGASRVAYAEIDDADDRASIRGEWTDGQSPRIAGDVMLADFGAPLIDRLRAGGTLAIADVHDDPLTSDGRPALDAIRARALLSVPLFKDGRFVVSLNVHHDSPRAWTDAEVELVEAVAQRTNDVLDRLHAELELRRNERRFRLMADAVPQIVWITDADGRTEFVNRQWTTYTGAGFKSPEAANVLASFVHPDDVAATAHAFDRARATGDVFEIEHRLRSADGDYRWFLVRADPYRDPASDAVVRWFGASTDIHARKQVEAALAESEARFRTMADHAPVMTWVTDATGYCTYLNARWYEFTGQEVGQGEAYGWLDAVHPDDRAIAEQAFVAANAEQRNYRVDFRLRRADGVYRWTIDAAAARFTPAGDFLGYVGSVIDITDRKEMEDELERRAATALAEKKLFAEIVEAADVTVQVIDKDFRLLAINEAAKSDYRELFGAEPQVGQSLLDVLARVPAEQASARAAWSRVLAGEAYSQTAWWGDPALERRAIEMRFRPLLDAGGGQIGGFMFGQDVTERMQEQEKLAAAEAARREADALYRAYFENTAEALFVVNVHDDGGFSIEDLNPAHQASIGLPLADVAGKRLDTVLPADLYAKISGHYRRVVASGQVSQYRDEFELKGQPTYWDTVLVPVFDGDRIVRLIGSSRDLTAQHAAEDQLRQSQKMEAMGQLTGGVAHDFNNLLTPIVGSLDMLMRRGLGNEREQRLIGGAMQSAERAKTLVQRLLAFARRQPLQASAVDLGQLVTGMAGLIESTLGPTVDVRVELADDLPAARADANQLEMALLNLAVNARDAMPDGGVLTIAAARETLTDAHRAKLAPGDYMRLSVTDSGIGMDADTLRRAVEPFFSTKGIGKGTGLGLSMVHGLAAQLGGGVTLASEPGHGTTVDLWLPLSADQVDRAQHDPRTHPAATTSGRALLVDDEELVRTSTAAMLADLGYDVIEAASGGEALRLLDQAGPFDLLVTDHVMPGMSGVDLARASRLALPDLPVLIISGYAEVDGLAADLPRLTKPFRNAELAERIAELRRPADRAQ